MQVISTFSPEFINQLAAAVILAVKSEIKASEATNAPKDAEILFTVKEAASKLKMCPKTVLNKIDAGLLKAANVGSLDRPQYRVSKADMQAFYHANRTK